MYMSFLVLRSRRYLVEISRVIDRYRICRFFPSYSSGSSVSSCPIFCHRPDFFPCISQPIASSIRQRLRFSRSSPTSLRRLMLEIMHCSACLIYRQRLIPSTTTLWSSAWRGLMVFVRLLFLLYTADVGELADSLGLSSHFYADDSQLYTWGHPSSDGLQKRRMELGVERIAEWMRSNRLCLNSEKTEFLWCATGRRCPHLDTGELSVCGSLISPVTVVRDLGVMLQSDLSMKDHVARTVSRCFRQLRLLKGCIKSLPFEAARAAVAAFVTSQVDRCNSLLVGAPKYLLDYL